MKKGVLHRTEVGESGFAVTLLDRFNTEENGSPRVIIEVGENQETFNEFESRELGLYISQAITGIQALQ